MSVLFDMADAVLSAWCDQGPFMAWLTAPLVVVFLLAWGLLLGLATAVLLAPWAGLGLLIWWLA